MKTFFMFGKYSLEALNGMSAERTDRIKGMVEKAGGRMQSMHATLGQNDLVFIASFPDDDSAMKASVIIAKATGITFSTAPAVTVEEFDRITSDI